jgi:hypothetical protein
VESDVKWNAITDVKYCADEQKNTNKTVHSLNIRHGGDQNHSF